MRNIFLQEENDEITVFFWNFSETFGVLAKFCPAYFQKMNSTWPQENFEKKTIILYKNI